MISFNGKIGNDVSFLTGKREEGRIIVFLGIILRRSLSEVHIAHQGGVHELQ